MSDTMAQDTSLTEYVVADGQGSILLSGNIPRFMIDIQVPPEAAEIVIGYGRAASHYVAEGVITSRPANTATLDGMTLKTLPVPSTITIDGTAHACTDDHCDLEFTQPGTYDVMVSAWPMLDAAFKVTQT
jgi:hypothetical protein